MQVKLKLKLKLKLKVQAGVDGGKILSSLLVKRMNGFASRAALSLSGRPLGHLVSQINVDK